MPTTPDFIPASDAGLLSWANNYSTLITATPTAFGLVAGDATATAAALTAFSAALTLAVDPATRTPVTVATKDSTRATLVALVRNQVRQIQATPAVTDPQKVTLGITPQKTTRTPIPAPTTRPILTVTRSNGPILDIRVNDELTPDTRALPFGYAFCQIFMLTGTTPPVTTSDAALLASVAKCVNQLDVSAVAPGVTMHFIAVWVNRRGQVGPVSEVVSQIRTN